MNILNSDNSKEVSKKKSKFTNSFYLWINQNKIIFYLFLFPVIIYLILIGSNSVYITHDSFANTIFKDYPLFNFLDNLNLPGLKNPGPIYVKELNILHTIRNSIFYFSETFLLIWGLIFLFLAGISYTLYGLFYLNEVNLE